MAPLTREFCRWHHHVRLGDVKTPQIYIFAANP